MFSLLLIPVLLGLPVVGSGVTRAHQDTSEIPPVSPNIMLVVTDDQRWDLLDFMPRVQERLGERGATFTNAFVTTSLCCPSRVSILTGQYVHNHDIWWNTRPMGGAHVFAETGGDQDTVAVWLQEAGYRTSYIGKYLNDYDVSRTYVPPGWDDWHATGIPAYYDYTLNENGEQVSYGTADEDYSTDVFTDKAIEFINDSDDPFFLYYSPSAPHLPALPAPRHEGACDDIRWDPAPSFNEDDVSDKPEWVQALSPLSDTRIRQQAQRRQKQICSLQAVDESIGTILDSLGDRGDDTVVIFTSDNGYSWGEHRWTGKNCVYDECARVPFLISAPPFLSEPETYDGFVLNVDIAPTIADLAGIATPETVDGTSLVPILNGQGLPERREVLLEHLNFTAYFDDRRVEYDAAVRNARYKFVRLGSDEEEFYDLTEDPYELTNEIDNPAYDEVIAELRAKLEELQAS